MIILIQCLTDAIQRNNRKSASTSTSSPWIESKTSSIVTITKLWYASCRFPLSSRAGPIRLMNLVTFPEYQFSTRNIYVSHPQRYARFCNLQKFPIVFSTLSIVPFSAIRRTPCSISFISSTSSSHFCSISVCLAWIALKTLAAYLQVAQIASVHPIETCAPFLVLKMTWKSPSATWQAWDRQRNNNFFFKHLNAHFSTSSEY